MMQYSLECRVPVWAFRLVVLFHASFALWSYLDAYYGTLFVMNNLLIILLGCSALVYKESTETVFLYAFFMFLSIVNDSICLGVYTKDHMLDNAADELRFSFACAIINLVLKPVYLFISYVEHSQRTAGSGSTKGENEYSHLNDGNQHHGASGQAQAAPRGEPVSSQAAASDPYSSAYQGPVV